MSQSRESTSKAGQSKDLPEANNDSQSVSSAYCAVAVRYQIKDVDRAIAFYTEHLGFTLTFQFGTVFAKVASGGLVLYLSGPQSSGARPMPNGQIQSPGGWNRIVIQVKDLQACIEALEKAGVHFRNQVESGPGGKQIQIEDPDGNPLELFEPAA